MYIMQINLNDQTFNDNNAYNIILHKNKPFLRKY